MEGKGSLGRLAEEYYSTARLQSGAIERNRAKLANAKQARNSGEYLRLKKLLCMLYMQRREVLEVAHYLKDYYKFSSFLPAAGGAA